MSKSMEKSFEVFINHMYGILNVFVPILFFVLCMSTFVSILSFLNVNFTPEQSITRYHIFKTVQKHLDDSYIIARDYNKENVRIQRNNSGKTEQVGKSEYSEYPWGGHSTEYFDDEFLFSRIIPEINLGIACIFFINAIILGYRRYRYLTDSRFFTNQLLMTMFMLIFIAINGFIAYKGELLYQLGHRVYNEAVEAIPLNLPIDKDKIPELLLSYKSDLVNSYLKKNIEHNTPKMYSVRDRKFIPYNEKMLLTNETVVDNVFDKMIEESMKNKTDKE